MADEIKNTTEEVQNEVIKTVDTSAEKTGDATETTPADVLESDESNREK